MAARVVVVTGSSSGIGRAIALAFARQGELVFVHGNKNRIGLERTVQEMKDNGGTARSFLADISDSNQAQALVDAAFAWQSRVDVWINAAGADVLTGSASELSFQEKLECLIRVDVLGTIHLSREVAARMQQQTLKSSAAATTRPTIINLSWDQADAGMEGDSGQFFSAVKAAVAAFSKSLAKTIGPQIRVNCIAPGWIQTEWGKSASAEWDQRARGESMLARWGTPEDIAQAAVMLASPECEFINGQTISVNGGWKPRN